jgi:type II secretory pathway component PulM
MNKRPQQQNIFLEKLSTFAQKVKALLTQDYSMQDLRNLPNLLKDWWSNSAQGLAQTSGVDIEAKSVALKSTDSFDVAKLPQILLRFVGQQRKFLLTTLLLLLVWIVYLLILAPYSLGLQERLEMRPAQWSQLQSLIRASKMSATGAGLSSTVSALDDQEMQRVLNNFTARGVKPSVFRLTTDNPPRLEFQASDVMFSALLDILEELRISWRLYPTQLSVVANGGAGMVNVSGVLTQYGTNATQAGISQ